MSKSVPKSSANNNRSEEKDGGLDRRYRHSFQPKSSTELPPSSLRHTQSHRYDSRDSRKAKRPATVYQIPSIMEADNSEDETEKTVELRKEKTKFSSVVYENEKKTNRTSKTKKGEINTKTAFSFENSGFEGNINTKRNSTATTSSRAPSVQSLEVVREQYCCCAKRTKCERILLITVTVLVIIIIVLVIVVVIVAKDKDLEDLKKDYFRL